MLGVERGSKLLLAHHVGRRTLEDANVFAAKLATATRPENGERFQVSTDAFPGYAGAFEQHLGGTVDYGQVVIFRRRRNG